MKTERVANLQDRLKEALDMKGIKAIELSRRTNIPKGAISYYLLGKSSPKGDRLYIMAQELSVSEAWLLGYDVPMNRTEEQKKNDNIVKIVAQMRKEKDFFDVVSDLAKLQPEEYAVVKAMISTLKKK